jgi:hypothetical protein
VRSILAFTSFAFLLAATAPVVAQPAAGACDLKQLGSVELLMRPEFDGVFVRATLNGVPKYLMLDTDMLGSTLSRDTADQLRLDIKPLVEYVYRAGRSINGMALVDKFVFGRFPAERSRFYVERMPYSQADGYLAPAFRLYDIELDFAAARMNFFEPSSCIQGPHWPNSGGAAIDLNLATFGLLRFPVLLDGKRVMASLDMRVPGNTIKDRVAKALFGTDPRTTGVVTPRALTTEDGGITINNPRLTLTTVYSTAPRNIDPDVALGLSTVRHLHIYIAYKRQKMFLTAASGPPAATMRPSVSQSKGSSEITPANKSQGGEAPVK